MKKFLKSMFTGSVLTGFGIAIGVIGKTIYDLYTINGGYYDDQLCCDCGSCHHEDPVDHESETPVKNYDYYNNMNVTELRSIAHGFDIPRVWRMKKDDIIAAILAKSKDDTTESGTEI